MKEVGHFAREAAFGILRNWRAALAAALLLLLAVLFLSLVIWTRSGLQGLYGYLENQLTMKLYVAEGYETGRVAQVVAGISTIERLEIVTGEEQLAAMAEFFQDKPRLLSAFGDGAIPDAIGLQLKPDVDYAQLATELGRMEAIEKVVYPQALAEQAVKWSAFARRYSLLLLGLFAAAGFLTVFLAVRLALLQRSREIRLKLMLGANPRLVAMQYMLEGFGMGLLGGVPGALASAWGYDALVDVLREQWPAIFLGITGTTGGTLAMLLAIGPLFGMLAAYTAARRRIRDV